MANSGVARGVDAASLDVDMALCITRELLFACHAAERPSIFREVARMGPRSWATVCNQAGRAVTTVTYERYSYLTLLACHAAERPREVAPRPHGSTLLGDRSPYGFMQSSGPGRYSLYRVT